MFSDSLKQIKPISQALIDATSIVVKYSDDYPSYISCGDQSGKIYLIDSLSYTKLSNESIAYPKQITPKCEATLHPPPSSSTHTYTDRRARHLFSQSTPQSVLPHLASRATNAGEGHRHILGCCRIRELEAANCKNCSPEFF